jgi:transposase InsO family protein
LDGHAWAAPNSDTSQLPWLTVLVDTHSRAVVGVVVSDSAPTATTIFKLVHSAAEQRTAPGLRRGPPARLELWSAGVDAPALLTALTHRLPGTAVALPRPNACMHRGLVERVFQHLSRRRGQAGEETL